MLNMNNSLKGSKKSTNAYTKINQQTKFIAYNCFQAALHSSTTI